MSAKTSNNLNLKQKFETLIYLKTDPQNIFLKTHKKQPKIKQKKIKRLKL